MIFLIWSISTVPGLIGEEAFTDWNRCCSIVRPRAEHFVAYFHHHTEIQFAIRAGRAADAVLGQLTPARTLTPGVGQSAGGYIGALFVAGWRPRREWCS